MISFNFHKLFEELLSKLSYADLLELDNSFTTITNLYIDLRHELDNRVKNK